MVKKKRVCLGHGKGFISKKKGKRQPATRSNNQTHKVDQVLKVPVSGSQTSLSPQPLPEPFSSHTARAPSGHLSLANVSPLSGFLSATSAAATASITGLSNTVTASAGSGSQAGPQVSAGTSGYASVFKRHPSIKVPGQRRAFFMRMRSPAPSRQAQNRR